MPIVAGKRIAVTGGAGFLGREVCASLQRFGPASIFVPRSRQYDLREMDQIVRMLDDSQAEVVVHLAAVVGGIGANRRNPGRYFYDNAVMGIQLLEAARRRGVEKVVVVGTICSYPKHTPVPFHEADLWSGYPEETNAPYGLAKKMLIVQAQAYRQQYGMNAVSLLPVNLYGPGDNFEPESSHVIPALIRKAVEARNADRRSIEAWGSGNVSREFIFVRDAADAIAKATDLYNRPEPMNIGTGREVTIRELAKLICELADFRGDIVWNANQPDGQPRRCLDVSRARDEIGFTASTELRDGLLETIRWWERQEFGGARSAA